MKNDRLLVPVDDSYVISLGRATYVFATLEWNAVWCCERLQPGYIRGIRKKTAGKIATDLVRLAGVPADPELCRSCSEAAEEFKDLVEVRNGILHGKPGTAPGGAQRLFRDGQAWSTEDIDAAADAFAACSSRLNVLLHGPLKVT